MAPACASVNIRTSWVAVIQPQSYKKILVLGITNEPEPSTRKTIESYIYNNLKEYGYAASCSCDEFGPVSFNDMTEEQALESLRNKGIDAVITVVLIDKSRERYYSAGRIFYTPYAGYQNRFWRYYGTLYSRIHQPQYYTSANVIWETNFYQLNRPIQLVYTAQSHAFRAPQTQALLYEYGKLVLMDMLDNNVINNRGNAGR